MPKYPIYIVSKGRYENPITANCFLKHGMQFKVLVEPQEYDHYCASIGKEYVQVLPFNNLGLGSYPARNEAWKSAIEDGYDRHWVFDDNIRVFSRLHRGKRIECDPQKAIEVVEEFTDRYVNIGISGFNYRWFVMDTTKKPFFLNVHVYSALLINNGMDFRWRMKYNEDVDLCLQVLDTNKLCTVLFNAFNVDKISTIVKMKGGNQTELYKGNAYEKKVLKARSLEEVWPQYAKTTYKFNRPHHHVNWKKHFKQPLIRRDDLDWDKIAGKTEKDYGFKLTKQKEIQSEYLRKWFNKGK